MSYKINAFPLVKGNIDNGTGVYSPGTFLCSSDGELLITWEDATTTSVDAYTGDAYTIENEVTSVEIVSGTFSRA